MPFSASPVLHKNLSSSSRSWLSRQARDPYVKQRSASLNALRSRSAFKLLDLDRDWGSFLSKRDIRAVIDLGAAPGGWSQVVAEKLGWLDFSSSSWGPKPGRGVIVSVDLLPMEPIRGVHTLQMDFLSPQAGDAIKAALRTTENPSGKADIILSDMAANFSGYKIRDAENSLNICQAVFAFAKDNLHVRSTSQDELKAHRGGTLLLKHFGHPHLQDFRKQFLEPNFLSVHYVKPASSRAESAEGYWLCRGWKGTSSSEPTHSES